jgi:hypothetical protein
MNKFFTAIVIVIIVWLGFVDTRRITSLETRVEVLEQAVLSPVQQR